MRFLRADCTTERKRAGSLEAFAPARFLCGSPAGETLGSRRLGTLRGRLLVVGGEERQIHVKDLRHFTVSNDEAHIAALIVRLAFPRFPPGAAIAGAMLLQLRIVAPRRFPFCGPYYQQLANRLFGFTASCCREGTFAGLNPLPAVHMYS
jgi:hypothetical protein